MRSIRLDLLNLQSFHVLHLHKMVNLNDIFGIQNFRLSSSHKLLAGYIRIL